MHSFKKAILASVLFLLGVAMISRLFLGVYYYGDVYSFEDAKARRDMAGSIDFIFIGASYGRQGFIPAQFDEAVGCNSYNLSSSMIPIYGRKVLIEKELDRNPVQTVVLEISFDALERDQRQVASAEGDAYLLARLDTPLERISYIASYVPFDNLDYCYATAMRMGVNGIKSLIVGDRQTPASETKGFVGAKANDMTLPQDKIADHDAYALGLLREENLKEVGEIIDLCKQHNVELLIVFTPLPVGTSWLTSGEDDLYQTFCSFCDKYDCPVINFDLYKNRFSLLKDASSYEDNFHLSEDGARVFTSIFADVYQKIAEGKDVSGLFYETYAEMEAHSPYAVK